MPLATFIVLLKKKKAGLAIPSRILEHVKAGCVSSKGATLIFVRLS